MYQRPQGTNHRDNPQVYQAGSPSSLSGLYTHVWLASPSDPLGKKIVFRWVKKNRQQHWKFGEVILLYLDHGPMGRGGDQTQKLSSACGYNQMTNIM